MSHFYKWLLMYGREKAKYVVTLKTALLLFSGNVEIKRVLQGTVLASYSNFCEIF